MKSQDGFPRILHLRKRKKSGAALSEEVYCRGCEYRLCNEWEAGTGGLDIRCGE